ncbi:MULTISPECIES: hypothetical protein [Bradyrhizobium]|uniref:hypothetical protein n=1 Tax=Bradyrhizobium TaxID=374 RepID=UPI001B8A54DE|nr:MULTISPECIES: hypothetical protein [Bradyrhizobium]MBR0975075.1 hypothetical protein [Bradyrhizobium japonicum]
MSRLEELHHAGKRYGLVHARPVDLTLQDLPLDFAVIELADRVAQLLLGALEIGGNPASPARGLYENRVVIRDSVVEIDSDPHETRLLQL